MNAATWQLRKGSIVSVAREKAAAIYIRCIVAVRLIFALVVTESGNGRERHMEFFKSQIAVLYFGVAVIALLLFFLLRYDISVTNEPRVVIKYDRLTGQIEWCHVRRGCRSYANPLTAGIPNSQTPASRYTLSPE